MALLAALQSGVLPRLLYVVVFLGVGVGGRATGLLGTWPTARLNGFAFYVALPALVFGAVYGQSFGRLVSPALVGGLWVVLLGTALAAWVAHRQCASATRRGIATVQSYHTSVGVLGLPLVAALFDARVTAVASVVLGVVAFSQLPLTLVLLTYVSDAAASLRDELGRLLRNPVLVALGAGVLVSASGLSVPARAVAVLDGLGGLALPAALVCVGASLPVETRPRDLETTGVVAGLKLGLMPLLAWVAFSLLGVSRTALVASVVMLAMPTAVSTFVYAGEFSSDGTFASTNVFVTIVGSVGSLFAVLHLLR